MPQEAIQDANEGEKILSDVTEEVTDKKCPNCGATIIYDPETRGMLCEYCGYKKELPLPDSEESIVEIDFLTAENKKSFDWGVSKKSIVCSNCGGESIYDALETAAVCPFCGSTSVMPAANNESIAPGGVCPFEIPMNKAGSLFTKWLKGKIFTPSAAKKQAKPEAFKGVYLPYWTFDSLTTSSFTGQAGYDRQVKRGDSYVTETSWRSVSGVYQEFIDDQLVVASKRNEDSGVKRAEPFDFAKMVPYRPELVAGFIAERYSIGLQDGWTNAQELIRNRLRINIESFIRKNWNADRAGSVHFSTQFDKITFKYILIPVWISSFTYKGKSFQFVVNGQTGKVGGKAPVSPLRVAIAILIAIAIIALIVHFS
jgi:DNA-directed RNA polymerase subunit RPC12/RpoP